MSTGGAFHAALSKELPRLYHWQLGALHGQTKGGGPQARAVASSLLAGMGQNRLLANALSDSSNSSSHGTKHPNEEDGLTILHIGTLSSVVRSVLQQTVAQHHAQTTATTQPQPSPLQWTVSLHYAPQRRTGLLLSGGQGARAGVFNTLSARGAEASIPLDAKMLHAGDTSRSGPQGPTMREEDRVKLLSFGSLPKAPEFERTEEEEDGVATELLAPGEYCLDRDDMASNPQLLFQQLLGQRNPVPCVDLLVVDALGFNPLRPRVYQRRGVTGTPELYVTGKDFFASMKTAETVLKSVAPLLKKGSSVVTCTMQKLNTEDQVYDNCTDSVLGNPNYTERKSKNFALFQGLESAYQTCKVAYEEPVVWNGAESDSGAHSGTKTELRGLKRCLVVGKNFGSDALQDSTPTNRVANPPTIAAVNLNRREHKRKMFAKLGDGKNYLGKEVSSGRLKSLRSNPMERSMLKRCVLPPTMSYSRVARMPSFMSESSPPASLTTSNDLNADDWLVTNQQQANEVDKHSNDPKIQAAIRWERSQAKTRVKDATAKWKQEIGSRSLRTHDPKKQWAVGTKQYMGHKDMY